MGSKITVDGNCSHKIKRCLPFGRKAMTKIDKHIKKERHHLLTNILLVKVMVFPIVIYGYESWTIKKTEHWRTDVFKLWV